MKKNALLLGLILTICTSVFGSAPPAQWAARYNGPGNGTDEVHALALDSSGNVYVTGRSWVSGTNYEYATIKYSPDGNQLWVARYNSGDCDAHALTVDSSGNVYVTGGSNGRGWSYDYTTIKYAPDGNQLWERRYNGPIYSLDIARAIAVDNSGNICVTGESFGFGTNADYATVKYSPDGNQLWVARYNGDANGPDNAYAVGVDNLGNVYVTGVSPGSSTSNDYATIKYDPNGNELWVARYNGPGNSDDAPQSLAVDSSGNVYVTGMTSSSGTYNDYATIKYNHDGNQLWVARYNGDANDHDDAYAVEVDSSGNVYVAGASLGSGTYYDYATIKYSPDGNQLWVARYNGDANAHDYAYAVAVDSSGNVYVSGASFSGTSYDCATIKYDPNGNELWVARYNGPGNSDDVAKSLAIDNSDNVFVTGVSTGSGTGSDYVTLKYTEHVCISPIAGDLNNDCKVDFGDFAVFASHWLECNYYLEQDCW